MRSTVKKIDYPAPVGPAAWLGDADKVIWSLCALAQRSAGQEVQFAQTAFSLRHRRASLASASGEIARARELASFIVDPDTRKRARKAVAAMAKAVRTERGV
jgi:hypothetical protein